MTKNPRAQRRKNIFVPSTGPDSWRQLLMEPDKQWRVGYSAHSIASAWEEGAGLPGHLGTAFESVGFVEPQVLFAVPEWVTDLPDGYRGSQSDLFALVRTLDQLVAVTVEGKVDEPFGPTVKQWLAETSSARPKRLADLCELLSVPGQVDDSLRYQLFHRTASAIIEASRFKADAAAMIVQSFSSEDRWFDDFSKFAAFLGVADVTKNRLHLAPVSNGCPLYIGWCDQQ
jgi:hypothetical protein